MLCYSSVGTTCKQDTSKQKASYSELWYLRMCLFEIGLVRVQLG